MSKTWQLGILGCGDFLRWQSPALKKSTRVRVKTLYDPDPARAAEHAAELGGREVRDDDDIFSDPEIDAVCLFVPPWVRAGLVQRAAGAGKHVITTKPLAPSLEEADAIARALGPQTRCAVLYGRSGDPWTEATKALLDDGRLGRLALYRQDWLHHYPQWNNWALDPEKNGGPFMDAMIHNLNAARYLMGRPVARAALLSERLAHPDLTCPDTEAMTLRFEGGGAALLFITWAADLEVRSLDGNDREHIDHFYLVTDKGWLLTRQTRDGAPVIRATREGREEIIPAPPLPATTYDRFAEAAESGAPNPGDLPTAEDAREDIRLLLQAPKTP